jgi:uncharacterized membrane protein
VRLAAVILSALMIVFFKGRGVQFFNQMERLAIANFGILSLVPINAI